MRKQVSEVVALIELLALRKRTQAVRVNKLPTHPAGETQNDQSKHRKYNCPDSRLSQPAVAPAQGQACGVQAERCRHRHHVNGEVARRGMLRRNLQQLQEACRHRSQSARCSNRQRDASELPSGRTQPETSHIGQRGKRPAGDGKMHQRRMQWMRHDGLQERRSGQGQEADHGHACMDSDN